MTEAALRTPLCIYMTTKTLLRPMLHRLSPNEGRMHFFALLPHQLTKYSNAMAMVSMAGHVFLAIWHAARQATGLANTAPKYFDQWSQSRVQKVNSTAHATQSIVITRRFLAGYNLWQSRNRTHL